MFRRLTAHFFGQNCPNFVNDKHEKQNLVGFFCCVFCLAKASHREMEIWKYGSASVVLWSLLKTIFFINYKYAHSKLFQFREGHKSDKNHRCNFNVKSRQGRYF